MFSRLINRLHYQENGQKNFKATVIKQGSIFSAPYDFEAVDLLDNLNVPAHKVGSGDITWIEIIQRMCKRKVPIFLATGASNINDVERAMKIIQNEEVPVCLMQCNTNYTGKNENFEYINLNVLKQYSQIWPEAVLGLSDHTSGHATVLGAVALGARAIEKHFTDDKSQEGPDHGFSMDPIDWKEIFIEQENLNWHWEKKRKIYVKMKLKLLSYKEDAGD